MKKHILFILVTWFTTVTTSSLIANSPSEMICEDSEWENKENCSCIKKDQCNSFFCECMPLFQGLVSNKPVFVKFLVSIPSRTFVPIRAEHNGSISSGRIASVCTLPIFGCNGQILIPAGRLNLCHTCGWTKITFDGDIRFNITGGDEVDSQLVTITLKSVCSSLPDIYLGTFNRNNANFNGQFTTHINTEDVVNLNLEDNNCCTPGYYLQLETVGVSSFLAFVIFENARILVEADGPCGCCPKSNMKE